MLHADQLPGTRCWNDDNSNHIYRPRATSSYRLGGCLRTVTVNESSLYMVHVDHLCDAVSRHVQAQWAATTGRVLPERPHAVPYGGGVTARYQGGQHGIAYDIATSDSRHVVVSSQTKFTLPFGQSSSHLCLGNGGYSLLPELNLVKPKTFFVRPSASLLYWCTVIGLDIKRHAGRNCF